MPEESLRPTAEAETLRRPPSSRPRGFRNPWPSPQVAWSDPPWILEGRVATAWLAVERTQVAQLLSPDILPRGSEAKVRMRIRFYDVAFNARDAGTKGVSSGRFREAVVAFVSSVGSIDGEVSLFMWTDDDSYMAWGREIFGWPLMRAQFDFEGPLWSAEALSGSRADAPRISGVSKASLAAGSLGIRIAEGSLSTGGVSAATWITPRRVLRRAGLDPETREVLLVRPEVLEPGQKYEARGEAWLAFQPDHPLAAIRVERPSFEIIDGFRLKVGAEVSVVPEPPETKALP
jgi:hypothetical protein